MVRTDLDAVREGAHRAGATTNDAVLVAVAAALRRVLAGRGEALDHLVVTVPVSGRTNGGASEIGNQVSESNSIVHQAVAQSETTDAQMRSLAAARPSAPSAVPGTRYGAARAPPIPAAARRKNARRPN